MVRLIHYLLILLTGFLGAHYTVSPAPPAPNRVVTQIQVTIMHDGQTSEQTYTDNESMESILTYLRLTNATIVTTIAPESFRSDTYRYTLTYSDGGITTYQQIHHEYLQRNNESWRKISPKADLHFPSL